MAHRIITQVVVVGARVLGRAFVEAYKQAQASSKYARATAAAGGQAPATARAHAGLTLDEAYKILNVKPADGAALPEAETVLARYDRLFKTNDPKKGGSFYLQSKILRARERIEAELAKAGKAGKKPDSPKKDAAPS